MIVPVQCDVVCIKINIEDQQLFEEMMLACNMSYGSASFPSLSNRHSYNGFAIYYNVHQVHADRNMELDFYKRLSKVSYIGYSWTISSEDYMKILEKNGGTEE